MLELPNFGDMTTSATQFETCDKILYLKYPLKRPRVANFKDWLLSRDLHIFLGKL